MKTKFYAKSSLMVVLIFVTAVMFAQGPVITGPGVVCTGQTVIYSAPAGMTGYLWSLSGGGAITPGATPDVISVTWTTGGSWVVYVDCTNQAGTVSLALAVQAGPSITGPIVLGLPASLGPGVTAGQVYTTEPGMTNYTWVVSPAGQITAGTGTNSITVTWTNPTGQQSVSVNYTDGAGCTSSVQTVLIINWYPFAGPIDPASVIQFVDPLPHFAAGLRVNAKAIGNLIIKSTLVQQKALSTGTPVLNGIVGDPLTPNAGLGNYAAYAISTDGVNFGPAMWPAQTIETQVGNQLMVQYVNALTGVKYSDFNILADQTLMMNGYPKNGNVYTDPYTGDIPMVVHLHGGEMPSNSDGGPTAWFMPGYSKLGPGFAYNASSLSTYPNKQEPGTLWYHPHDQGLTRINVYTGLAGFYFLRGPEEDAVNLPGWSGDDLVREITPAGKTSTFNGTNAYKPEIEAAIQDRMFNLNGELFWPIQPTNPDIHPFWGPEFFGDIMTVNGKTYPYLSVAPRTYRFRLLNGCNARFLSVWLEAQTAGQPAPVISVIGSDGAFHDAPVAIDPALGQKLVIGPGERYDVVIDFTGFTGGVFTLRNSANAPYPDGDPVVPGLTDRIMQFVVNGELVSAADPTLVGTDKGVLPGNLRPTKPMVRLADFVNAKLDPQIVPDVKRQIILNEVTGAGGPVQVLFNNSHFDTQTPIIGAPPDSGGPTETPREGTTELISIINTTVDGHPIHVHLTQWQLVSRQQFDVAGYLANYSAVYTANSNLPEFPVGQGYPGGSGPPLPYDQPNAAGALGGNPDVTPFLIPGTLRPADPQERLWKDDVKSFPGEVATYIVRYAPTDLPINATPAQLMYSFDPSKGPGYVWHCHIIDHEDMDMMRPLMIQPSLERSPKISVQPAPAVSCAGDVVTYTVTATQTDTYQWQISTDGGQTWTNLTDVAPYAGSLTPSLTISPAALALTNSNYRCVLGNTVATVASTGASLTVNDCFIAGSLVYKNDNLEPLSGFTVTVNGKSAVTDALGAFTIPGVTSGVFPVTITTALTGAASSNSTDAGSLLNWIALPVAIPNVQILAGDANNSLGVTKTDPVMIVDNFVKAKTLIPTWEFWNANGSGTVYPPAFNVTVTGQPVTGFDINALCNGDFNGSFSPSAVGGLSNVVLTNTGEDIDVNPGTQFDLPLKAASSLQVGAISLLLNIPSNLVTVKAISVPGSSNAVNYKVTGNELRIGWASAIPVNVAAGGNLVVITFSPTSKFTAPLSMTVGIVANTLNELAGGTFVPLISPVLTVDNVSITPAAVVDLGLSAAPNPTTGSTTITYTTPVDGKVSLGLFNSVGKLVMPMFVNNLTTTAGTYSYIANVSKLKAGQYYLKLSLRTGTGTTVTTLTLVKQ